MQAPKSHSETICILFLKFLGIITCHGTIIILEEKYANMNNPDAHKYEYGPFTEILKTENV